MLVAWRNNHFSRNSFMLCMHGTSIQNKPCLFQTDGTNFRRIVTSIQNVKWLWENKLQVWLTSKVRCNFKSILLAIVALSPVWLWATPMQFQDVAYPCTAIHYRVPASTQRMIDEDNSRKINTAAFFYSSLNKFCYVNNTVLGLTLTSLLFFSSLNILSFTSSFCGTNLVLGRILATPISICFSNQCGIM